MRGWYTCRVMAMLQFSLFLEVDVAGDGAMTTKQGENYTRV